jgi:hypothetical protein
MHYVDATHIIQPDTRTPAERWLDTELERRGANEQGAEPGVLLRAIALELREQLTANTDAQGR